MNRQDMDLRQLTRDRDEIAKAVHRRVFQKYRRDSELIGQYIDDIAGGFDPRVFRLVTGVLRPLGARLELAGPIDRLRDLARGGTLVFAPTHSSHLDSIVFGMSLLRAQLPACVYATGKHMYRNRVVAALVSNLGAYRIDRAQHSRLYLLVLAHYAVELLERGLHSIIFPGATRSRSNEVERSLKLGLLGAALRADARVYIVPVTINYAAVLEAETLIRYHLDGRSEERIVGDELFAWHRLAGLARRVWALSKSVVIRFGEPLASPADTRQLGTALARAYQRNTVLFSTHVVARALYDLAQTAAGKGEFQRQLGLDRGDLVFASRSAHQEITRTVAMIRSARDKGRIHDSLDRMTPEAMVTDALQAWNGCHLAGVVSRNRGQIAIDDARLLTFYRNRTNHIAAPS